MREGMATSQSIQDRVKYILRAGYIDVSGAYIQDRVKYILRAGYRCVWGLFINC
jgi:ribulose bisphosphate carboxylase small subunit